MQLLYEEDGDLKVGAVLGESTASFQVESPHGRRSKIKAANVLLAFERPSGAELLAEADKFAQDLDIGFLWECSGSREFGFRDLAKDYVGREPTAVEAAGVLIKLHSAPMYFYRRGKGRFQAAPLETLKLALAAVEKRKRVQESIAAWAERLARFDCPPEVAGLKEELLYSPDRNKAEAKALEQACKQTGLTPARLFERCGLLPDAHEYHLQRFVHEFFPRGVRFPAHDLPSPPNGLPLAEVRAFSLDDVGTSEIDDAFSLQRTGETLRVGIHIAAPGLAFGPGSPLDALARERLSTAYMPGRKFTMLPEDVIQRFSLDQGGERLAVSLYFDVRPDWSVGARYTRLERVPVAANLRHAHYDRLNELFESGGRAGLAYEEDLHALWQIALALEASRGRPSAGAIALDYSFHVEDGRVRIVPRKRGAPLDKLVSEMMILANTSWGELLAERDVAGIYRVQSTGKVRLSVHPEPHEGLGVSCYAWMSSPLRRYVDLVNQWQLIAAVGGQRAPFSRNSDALLAALRAFEVTYARYDEHQRAMETYWVLRWLEQEAIRSLEGVVLRENLVRMEGAPLVTRVPSLPVLDPGTRVRLEVGQMDFLERSVSLTYRETLGTATASVADDLLPLG
ncbi:MAG TPA: RNB domain-containing ribonuclease [Burkholderiales bacterium]|jgi:exoribonuclease-2|nr:RNB domain-containing ribonuclease [Burkholderiales bacterium]